VRENITVFEGDRFRWSALFEITSSQLLSVHFICFVHI